MSIQLEGLKQELFAYWERHPKAREPALRATGFGTHLDTLYEGKWFAARRDFEFYQFVKVAQRYLGARSPENRQMQEKRLLQAGFPYLASAEDNLLLSIFGPENIESEKGEQMLGTLKAYVTQNPPVYSEVYRAGLETLRPAGKPVLQDFTQETVVPPVTAGSYKLLKDHVEEVLSTLSGKERRVLQMRFGLDDGKSKTLQQVADELGYKSGETARRIEVRALRKLRHPSRGTKLKDFLE